MEIAAKSVFLSMTKDLGKRDLKQRSWIKCLEIEMQGFKEFNFDLEPTGVPPFEQRSKPKAL